MRNILYQQFRKKRNGGVVIPPTPSVVNNQLAEIDYFNSYLLPLSEKANLQIALDTYNSVRLDKGDYGGVSISMNSNQKLYGHPSLTSVSNITILAGSDNVHIENVKPSYGINTSINFQSGELISNCTIKTTKYIPITGVNVMLFNNSFINIVGLLSLDCSDSGYFRNNKIIKHQIQTNLVNITLKGNNVTPSYGNVHLHTNILTPWGDATDIDGLQSATFVGLDAEGWSLNGLATRAMFYAKNMGDVKITDFGGANGYSASKVPVFNIEADNTLFLNKQIDEDISSGSSLFATKTNIINYVGRHDDYIREVGAITGFDLKGHYNDGINTKNILLDNINQTTLISASIELINSIKGIEYAPWVRPTWETLPDPLGANWRTQRAGKPDSRAYIQNLIDTNGIAELPEGIFYIGSTLNLIVDGTKGIIGKGTGKTVICGLTDDFPLITLAESPTGDHNFELSNLTLQGGSTGLYAPDSMTNLVAFSNLRYIIFRNQNYGIHLYRIFGLDNCFLDNVSFINCNTGFFQDPHPTYTFENAGYVDKVVFYNGQFLNCGVAVSMRATRADNLNAWINCKFDNNEIAFDIYANNYPIVANCDFTNHTGENIIRDSPMSLYNCNFYNNSVTDAIIRGYGSIMEGCNLQDNIKVFSSLVHYNMSNYILNSTILGDVTRTYGFTSGIYSNSLLNANLSLSKLLVNVKDNIPTVLLDATPTPYPQLLVMQ